MSSTNPCAISQAAFLQQILNLVDIAQDKSIPYTQDQRDVALAKIYGKCESRQSHLESKFPSDYVSNYQSIDSTLGEVDSDILEIKRILS